ncbi:ferredoxin [Isoptericola sp. b441]|uniref:Ferredoxin n=1 Tax=Actinotalea lenta TaxID=3064654 RepID=A0ABT9D688_9CELL|nr:MULTISPECIES: ferredoxin [unclassified Isoptericola]MDO8106342.1 ferredoxin [Isoptericola sp. b441]MDO8121939.1 ferredoxin [Isoptericola sp. b490]
MNRAPSAGLVLRVDPVACEGVGLCAQVGDRVVDLDRWGYPVLEPLGSPADVRAARRAVRACPRRALWVEEVDPGL